MTNTHSLTHSDKATFWIIELLTLQLKKALKAGKLEIKELTSDTNNLDRLWR